jgi:hypothetical protein
VHSLDTMVRRILEGGRELSHAIAKKRGRRRQKGARSHDYRRLAPSPARRKDWAQTAVGAGYGKVPVKMEGGDIPISHTFALKIDNG